MFGKKQTTPVSREPKRRVADFESELVAFARSATVQRKKMAVLAVHLSRSVAGYNQDNYVYATNMFRALISRFDGQLFVLKSRDLVFAYHGLIGEPALRQAVSNIRLLFEVPGQGVHDFVSWFDLERDDEAFLGYAEAQFAAAATTLSGPDDTDPNAGNFGRFARFMAAFEQADLEALLRRQPLCRIDGGRPEPQITEIYVSIPDLERTVAGAAGISADRHLFHYVGRALDRRVLQRLGRDLKAAPVSVNLTMATVMSPDWDAFVRTLDAAERARLSVEVAHSDALADIGMFLAVQDKLRESGVALVLDGLSARMLPYIRLQDMDVQLFKLIWEPSLSESGAAALAEAVERCGAERFALCRCDGPEAVRFGRSLGITRFQGRHIDRLLAGQPEPQPKSDRDLRPAVQPMPVKTVRSGDDTLVCL